MKVTREPTSKYSLSKFKLTSTAKTLYDIDLITAIVVYWAMPFVQGSEFKPQ